MTAELEGLNELSKQLSKLGSAAGGKALRSAAMRSTLPVVKTAKARAPIGGFPHFTHKGRLVGPGFLRRSVARKSRLSPDKRTATVLIGVRPEAFYGVQFLELGTSKIRKQPWLTDALESQQNTVVSLLSDILKKNIEKAAK